MSPGRIISKGCDQKHKTFHIAECTKTNLCRKGADAAEAVFTLCFCHFFDKVVSEKYVALTYRKRKKREKNVWIIWIFCGVVHVLFELVYVQANSDRIKWY